MEVSAKVAVVPPAVANRSVQRPAAGGEQSSGALAVKPVSGDQTTRKNDVVAPISEVENVVNEMNRFLERSTNIRFRIEESHNRVVVSVVDAQSSRVIRQIPSEEMLELNSRMRDLQGVIFNKQA